MKTTTASKTTSFDLNALLDATHATNKATKAGRATDTRIRTTEAQRAVLLHKLDPAAFPMPSRRHGGCCHALRDMGFLVYDTERGPDGLMKGWTFTPAGREKAEALRAVDRAEFG